MRVVAIVPAAGHGHRMNHNVSKQYLPLGGKPILVHTLGALARSPLIDDIFLVVQEDKVGYCQHELLPQYEVQKVRAVITGGPTRQDSVYNGLRQLTVECDVVLVHDSVRPFVTERMVQESVEETVRSGAAVVAVPMKDTIKVTKSQGIVEKTLARDNLWAVQTPQVFQRSLIQDAYEKAFREGFRATDDATLVERLGHPVKIVEGSPDNLKITTPEDLMMAEVILRERGY